MAVGARNQTWHGQPPPRSHPGPQPRFVVKEFTPFPKQKQFMEDVFSGDYRFMGFGGAIRGGKTIGAIEILFILCKVFPGSRWAIVRKDLPRIRRNTIPTIEKFAPRPFIGKLDKQEWKYQCSNGSEILLIGAQETTDPDLDRFKGLEVNGFVLEEANEVSVNVASKCMERMASWIIQPTRETPQPRQPPGLLLCTFNPADNWVREWFYDPFINGTIKAPYYFLPALPKDNPYNTAEQFAIWSELPPAQYKRFIEGDWDAIVDPFQLLTYQQIMDAAFNEPRPGKWKLGVDVGGDKPGADDTVFAPINGNIIDGKLIERVNGWESTRIAIRISDYITGKILKSEAREAVYIAADDVRIDSVGIGAGPYDIVRMWGKAIRAFIAGAKQVPRLVQPQGGATRSAITGQALAQPRAVLSQYIFKNLRGQAWYEFAEAVRRGEYVIVNPTREMIRDLTAPRFKYGTNEREILVDSTDAIKDSTGHSPDVGTAIVMGAFEWPRAAVVKAAPTGGGWQG